MRGGRTKRRAFFLAFFYVFFLLPPFSGLALDNADQPVPPPKMRALLIGCDHFVSQTDTWPAADNNLRLLTDTLIADERRYALIRSYSSAVSSVVQFADAVASAFQNAGPGDVSLLYIGTHGVLEGEEAGLLLSDGEKEEVLTGNALKAVLDDIPGVKVVVLDACNSGAMIGKGMSGVENPVFLSGPDYKVLCSAGGSEASWYFHGGGEEAAGASYFATVLAQGLGAQGDFGADRNFDGLITLEEVYAYLLDNYAASTPQAYPQHDGDFPLFSYDPEKPRTIRKAVTDITFQDTLLTAGQTEVTFSFTVQRQAELYYQVIYHQNGEWQFGLAQHFQDGEQTDGTVLPGRKSRTLALKTAGDSSGYAMIQLITLEDGVPVFQGARLLCVQPARGEAKLSVETGKAFSPGAGGELQILVGHNVPCGLTVSVLNEEGRAVRYLSYDAPTRPQQLSPEASSFSWDGLTSAGLPAPPGQYTVAVRTEIDGNPFSAESEPFELTADENEK